METNEIKKRKAEDHTFRNGKEFVGGGWPPYDKTKRELLEKEGSHESNPRRDGG